MYPTKKLSEIVTTIRWITYKPEQLKPKEEWIACFRTKNIQEFLDENDIYYVDPGILKNNDKILETGDILISSANSLEQLWKCCLIENLSYKATLWGFICAMRPNQSILNYKYFYLFFSSEKLQRKIRTFSKKTTWIANLQLKDVENLEIPLPPLSTQSRIVARLDSAFASIDEQISLLQANITDVENMRKSVLEESFQNGEYEIKKLWDIFDVRDGTHDSPKFHTTGYPLITSKNLSENGIDFRNIKLISQEDYDKINQRSKVDKWDLLFAMIGTIGTPTIVDIEPEFGIKNVALLKPKNTDADMQYLRYFLLSDFVIQKMLKESKWATQKFVGLGYLRAFRIPLPPLPRQHEIVAHLDRVFATTEALRGEYEAQIRDLEILKQSLLEEAFAGRLVTDEA